MHVYNELCLQSTALRFRCVYILLCLQRVVFSSRLCLDCSAVCPVELTRPRVFGELPEKYTVTTGLKSSVQSLSPKKKTLIQTLTNQNTESVTHHVIAQARQ